MPPLNPPLSRDEKKKKQKEITDKNKQFFLNGKEVTGPEFRGAIGKGSGGPLTPEQQASVEQSQVELGIAGKRAEENVQQKLQQERIETATPQLEQQFQQAGVFQSNIPTEPIVPEGERAGIGVIGNIAKSLIPESIRKAYEFTTLQGPQGETGFGTDPLLDTQVLMSSLNQASSEGIDARISETEQKLVLNGIPIAGVLTGVGAAAISSAVTGPVGEFVGTDRQISNLGEALSQYEEMVTLPAQAARNGMDSQEAFDKLTRMEDGIIAIIQRIQVAKNESPNIQISLRDIAIDARVNKLREKIQNSRREVAQIETERAFGETNIPQSTIFLNKLFNERKG